MRSLERWGLVAGALALVVVLPALNALPAGSPLRVSDFTLNLFGKFLAYAILALGIDLIWGYTGVLSLGHGVFFGLGAYAQVSANKRNSRSGPGASTATCCRTSWCGTR